MAHRSSRTRTLKVAELARVEGEGGVTVTLKDGRVTAVQLNIFESPRFFEAFLRGRNFAEAPDLTARICGICPVAYQMSSLQALEGLCGVERDDGILALRRLAYLGEWIESHALHVYMLHAPDFLGYESALHAAQDHPEVVKQGLALKKLGNELLALIGGREIHPINLRVGGLYHVPAPEAIQAFHERLVSAVEVACQTIRWVAGFSFPELERDYEFVALRHPNEYPLSEGRIVSSAGVDIDVSEYEEHFAEEHVPHSNALHSRLKARGDYLTGPLARYSLNFDRLTPRAQEEAQRAGLQPVCRNPFKSIIVRSVELLWACQEALRIIETYEPPSQACVEVRPRAGRGHGCSEAPRGILYHRYDIDATGLIEAAKLVPPTSQNLACIEKDLWAVAAQEQERDREELLRILEQAVRNHDPCISCATHCVRLRQL